MSMSNYNKIILKVTAFISALSFIIFADDSMAKILNNTSDMEMQSGNLGLVAGFDTIGDQGISQVIANVISGFLGLLGIIFIILIVIAGFHWMIAQGEEEKIRKAKDSIRHAIIGLIIVASAYAITYFVFTYLVGVGSGSGGLGGSP